MKTGVSKELIFGLMVIGGCTEEICFAITKANGYFYDDVKEMLVNGGFWKF